jgi:hypothetical protein
VKSWLISCGGREAGRLFYGFVIGNTNDCLPGAAKDKLPGLILIKV